MGSLITALQNQNIAAANQETLGDIYAANPTNLGYTDNPFGYTAAPAVVQTAYPKYGYNATAPMMPPSYEDYDLTTLFSMLQGMQAPQQDGQPQSFTAPVPTVAPMAEGQAPATPAGILAAMSAEPLSGSYSVPGTEPVVAEPKVDDFESRVRDLISADASKRERAGIISRYRDVVDGTGGFNPDPDISRFPNAEIERQTAEIARGIEQMKYQE
jgi:hypothetical protein